MNRDTERIKKAAILFILCIIVNFSMLSCAPEIAGTGSDFLERELIKLQDELGKVRNELLSTKKELLETQNELNATKSKLAETEEKLTGTGMDIPDLMEKLAEADTVKAKYEELKRQNDAILAGTAGITEVTKATDIEQAVFNLINKERQTNGLSALEWNSGLYSCAKTNNLNMAKTKSLVDSECESFQQAYWFIGYGSADRIAEIALTAWKNNAYSFTQNVLNNSGIGAVAVYESEGILYIDFLCYKAID